MYYIKKPLGIDQPVHIHSKGNKQVRIKNYNDGVLRNTLLTIKQTEDIFNAKFRWVTNDDKTKTKVFL